MQLASACSPSTLGSEADSPHEITGAEGLLSAGPVVKNPPSNAGATSANRDSTCRGPTKPKSHN